ncbi:MULTISPECIES: MarR family winged helix-turn-helix transcriptional regulator [Sulfitobacter]|jgi:DNA-binding MarR family transcriptional regulator|uniref:Transcriptional regulator, MarR family n=2 Tax=Sulfitobacter TaxID=60136 RepID=A0A1H3AM56_9RHOB|nr:MULTISPECIES: MarR family transcriptional regulator [Sulfitobacter]MAB17577.1 MarR family transcriptional regulator [Roseobacter sp.]AXI49771.1 MarR family transcriptional regulator [Sulfitobacter sp. SK025]EAP81250.1 transcriptional regulator, putative [Sulfitobacter sp. NAS-14.1]EAP85760.1 transcriptional regulator, putative [Sulfitobacter sp. EE-36]KAJ30459.1 MarR family transcriptional regulator [Sulfitobacter pontiacus 3SOLIMAR09]|tara:strand:- start:1236 stop:1673 length:438 start_codon:yes stop_codon:yes gene_type:complete
MTENRNSLAITLISELLSADQRMRNRLTRALPKGMEISHFSVLNNLAWHDGEKTPAQLAETFNVTRGAMTNTLNKLVWAGYVHIRPDWDDARRKMVAISPAGRNARDHAIRQISPLINDVADDLGEAQVRATLDTLRALRRQLEG